MMNADPKANSASRAWYEADLSEFVSADPQSILGQLVSKSTFDVRSAQVQSWRPQIAILQAQLCGLSGSIYLEFSIPRMGRRIDAVVLTGGVVFVLEFKSGESEFLAEDEDQAWDYALDLKNFHEASHGATIVPILIPTEAQKSLRAPLTMDPDGVYRPTLISPSDLSSTIQSVLQGGMHPTIDQRTWGAAPYRPTPTIVEAARALYAQHSVEDITRHHAGAANLSGTSRRIRELIGEARATRRKLICFVTGVPGAGKTLVGLNLATERVDGQDSLHAVFLSGNKPLVDVLREALVRDEVARQKAGGKKPRKGNVARSVESFIQNVHHYRDDALTTGHPPDEHIAVFDEAQRAWTQQQTASFMKRKKGVDVFEHSEPAFLMSYMDRHQDWAAVVCLVGGGQEINIGEAGIDAWLEAVNTEFSHWDVYLSPRLTDSEYSAGRALDLLAGRKKTYFDESLHLATSIRSFRSERVSTFVKALIDRDIDRAQEECAQLLAKYPIVITRELSRAKRWVREMARGSERYGLIASSRAMRLKPHAIDVRVKTDPVHWFLNGKEDPRSSYYLEDVATEFQVQGLEVDWACVTWDADFRSTDSGWSYHDFRGDRWQNTKVTERQHYVRSTYRVLLTRARQGMAIFVPEGDPSDHTRNPSYYDATFAYLCELGIPVIA
jgi:hypothetical protein